jgi:hypothetical protein
MKGFSSELKIFLTILTGAWSRKSVNIRLDDTILSAVGEFISR